MVGRGLGWLARGLVCRAWLGLSGFDWVDTSTCTDRILHGRLSVRLRSSWHAAVADFSAFSGQLSLGRAQGGRCGLSSAGRASSSLARSSVPWNAARCALGVARVARWSLHARVRCASARRGGGRPAGRKASHVRTLQQARNKLLWWCERAEAWPVFALTGTLAASRA